MQFTLLILGLCCPVMQHTSAKTNALIYVDTLRGNPGSILSLENEHSKFISNRAGLSFALPKDVEEATVSPDRKRIAALCRGNRLFISPTTDAKVSKLYALSKVGNVGSWIAEAVLWADSRRILVYMNDPENRNEDLVIQYAIEGDTAVPSVHKADSSIARTFVKYRNYSIKSYKILENQDVMLLGHHRALPYDADEIFGYLREGGLGAISPEGELAVMLDLLEPNILVIREGVRIVKLKRIANKEVVQLRVYSDLILIHTVDKKCEIWSAKEYKYLDTIPCDMIVDVDGGM